ncbi:hypothetical protein POPTR_005G020350v4 [Populus trichocarpa]|uniref:Uncharacterized protein n=1 Tax=Populus trichocarpa TaxID=3694 RepID=A0ACC0SXC9_POPTR|nr:hypothetical protein POPTR_005G020350v4 [Populus trichocarpa]
MQLAILDLDSTDPLSFSLPGEGGSRCSVKPASRCTLHSRSHDTHVFTRMPWFNSWLQTDKPESSRSRPNHMS